jgi:DNA recombination protein RmuC
MEEKRAKAYGSLHKELEGLRDSTRTLQEQSSQLTTALRGSSQARGRYGELLLRNVVEMAGMTEHCDFIEQETTETGQRPDVVVKLPPKGLIPIDAKCPMSAFLDAVAADDPKTRDALFLKHSKDLREKVRELKKADYASQLDGEIDFTVMFLPGDDLLAAAFKYDPDLQEYAINNRVLIATPVTLVALLRTVGVYWRQHDLAQGAKEIQHWAEELHKRVATFVGHFAAIGKHLGQAQESYNQAIGSYERRVRPAGQKLEQLNATQGELPEVAEVEEPVRQLTLPQ